MGIVLVHLHKVQRDREKHLFDKYLQVKKVEDTHSALSHGQYSNKELLHNWFFTGQRLTHTPVTLLSTNHMGTTQIKSYYITGFYRSKVEDTQYTLLSTIT